MSTTKVSIRHGDRPSDEALNEVLKASDKPVVFDEESPHFTKEEMRVMALKAKTKKEKNKKPVVALRVSPDTLELAKATGKGYTGFMSRLLDLAINDADMVRKAIEG
ncbi:MAG: BrnA antitoxin family protein [Mogibacterium sp.]|nr:BrnA antitoxin family protein [Mogibacterium sp.]